MTRAFLLLLHLHLLLTTHALDVSDAPDARYGAHKWTLLRGVEGTLRGTSSFVRGVGDTIAVSAGGAIRALGGIVNDAGGGLEGLGNAVTGEQHVELLARAGWSEDEYESGRRTASTSTNNGTAP